MADYVTLIGAEQVKHAGSEMQDAARTMGCAAVSLQEALSRHERFMDDWLDRLEAVLGKATSDDDTLPAPKGAPK